MIFEATEDICLKSRIIQRKKREVVCSGGCGTGGIDRPQARNACNRPRNMIGTRVGVYGSGKGRMRGISLVSRIRTDYDAWVV